MKTHEYLVKITINLPPNTPSTQREALLASEHKYGRQLVEQGIIRRIWRLPGQPSNIGVWVAQSAPQLHEVINLIQTLNPRPGSMISSRAPEYIVPDVTVYRAQGGWRVELNPDTAPRLRINPLYAGMVKRADNSADIYRIQYTMSMIPACDPPYDT
jgi:RNA polymerase sigma-54 factor